MAKIDSEDEFKRRMRRRLVGAVALVTALVVILPMLLENSPKPHEGNLELRIPDKNKSGAFTSQMVVAESAPDVTPLPAPGAPQAPAKPADDKSGKAASPAKSANPAKSAPATKSTTPARPADHAKPKVKPAKPGAKPVKHTDVQAGKTVASAAHVTATPKPSAHKAGFAVQVGAFSHAASARELQDKLSKKGWHVYTQKAGSAVRVRVGPFPGRAEALKAQHKLESEGVNPAAVVTEP